MNLVLTLALVAGSVMATWKASPTPGVSYYVYRAKGSCSDTFVRQTETKKLTYTESVPAGTFCYYVAAFQRTVSVPSNKVLITVK